MPFTSLEEIQQHYSAAINAAGDRYEAVAELKGEQRQMEIEFRAEQVARRERATWVRDAIHDFPLAKTFPDRLDGATEEEVRAAAQQLHEQLEVAFKDHQKAQEMQRVYEQYLAAQQQPPKEEASDPAAAV